MTEKWNIIKIEIRKADERIDKHKDKHTDFYHRQRMYWKGVKHGLGLAYKILKNI